jgi:DNA (cytosine-5)-methyltransferase 1
MSKPILLDTFCKAGGASMGYHLAGFEVVGVDIEPQKNYPFKFYQAEAIDFIRAYGADFAAIHASPPCQFASAMFNPKKGRDKKHLNLIPPTREALLATGKPYVIENVELASKHLMDSIMLHGSMFGLPIFRKRYFEIVPSFPMFGRIPDWNENYTPVPVNSSSKKGNQSARKSVIEKAMGINWMNKDELREAIPPAYTEFIGKFLMEVLS